MAWIKMIREKEASGALKEEYERALRRAGKVFNILKIQSLNPEILHASMDLYLTAMHGPSGLSRAERELLAVVVSWANHCFYWIEAHGEDLREARNNTAWVEQVKDNYLSANLSPREKALAKFAEFVTRTPSAVRRQNIETLRKHGLSDRDILDAVEVVAYFNYINRVADALGIDPEPEMRAAFERLNN
jgi:uncharacterized peroxidase-related enzyme